MTQEILEGISKILEHNPDLRFAQVMFQLGLYNPFTTDEDLLVRIREWHTP